MITPQIGWYTTICCIEDLHRIDTQEQLSEAMEQVEIRQFWTDMESAITELHDGSAEDMEAEKRVRAAATVTEQR